MPRLDGYKALIVGGGRGLGRSAAVSFAKEGADVAVAARPLEEINETVELVRAKGRKAIAVQTDARDVKQVETLVKKVIAEFGKIDILVNTRAHDQRTDRTYIQRSQLLRHVVPGRRNDPHLPGKQDGTHWTQQKPSR